MEALQRFAEAHTPGGQHTPALPPLRFTSKQQQRDLELVNQRLDEILGPRRCEKCRAEIVAPRGALRKGELAWCPKCIVTRKSATIGQRIRTFRTSALLSQQTLSGRTGIGVDIIRAYEFDQRCPTDAHLAKLIQTLGADLANGLAGESEEAGA